MNQPFDFGDKSYLGDPINTKFDLSVISNNRLELIDKAKKIIDNARDLINKKNVGAAVKQYRKALKLVPEWG